MVQKIRIISTQNGFRRLDIAHPKEATYYDIDKFTAAELKVLQDEPKLVVDVVEVEEDGTERVVGVPVAIPQKGSRQK